MFSSLTFKRAALVRATALVTLATGFSIMLCSSVFADRAFEAWKAELWADAEAFGISRIVFDRELKGVTPNRTLPDLVLTKRPKLSNRGQAEFTKPPQKYVNRKYIRQLADEGRVLRQRYKKALDDIESKIGVDRNVILAIWGRETAYGKYKPRHDAIRALLTQAYLGRRKDLFRNELLHALKLLEDRVIPRKRMRASWAGAMGLPQIMPSEFHKYAIDMDNDGRRDIFRSVPDALGTAAQQLKENGWIKGLPWGYEVRLGPRVNCSFEGIEDERSLKEWQDLGVRSATGPSLATDRLETIAYLMSPGGTYGPAFLVTENFKVIRRYNMSDLYALFVGHLSDRIGGGGDFKTNWREIRQLRGREVGEIQAKLQERGFKISVVDGKVGSNTRRMIGKYQVSAKRRVDCWPTKALLHRLRIDKGKGSGR